jgi:hypothetical protein
MRCQIQRQGAANSFSGASDERGFWSLRFHRSDLAVFGAEAMIFPVPWPV